MRNCTWTLVPQWPNNNLVGCKWVLMIKSTVDRTIDHYKDCLVAKGFHQQPVIDFSNTQYITNN